MNTKVISYLKGNKKLLMLLLAGIILVLIGNGISQHNENSESSDNMQTERINIREFKKILSNIEGAGNVEVFITYDNSGKTEYAFDLKTANDDGTSSEKKHVFSNKEPVVTSKVNAEIRGVIATSTGASDKNVKNKLMRCIKAVTGIGYDRISVETGVK